MPLQFEQSEQKKKKGRKGKSTAASEPLKIAKIIYGTKDLRQCMESVIRMRGPL